MRGAEAECIPDTRTKLEYPPFSMGKTELYDDYITLHREQE